MPDRIAKTRQSGEESSLREKVAQAILHVQETNRSAFPNNLELADAAIAVCMEEAWQPIETAPKDGTHVLVADDDGLVGEARWIDHDENWWRVNNDPTDHWGEELYPTHWQPLPEPPLRTLDKRLEKPGKGENG